MIRAGQATMAIKAIQQRRTPMPDEPLLPAGFETLAPYLESWALADSAARSSKRQASTINELREFYAAMLPLAAAALDYLREHKLGTLPPPAERLLKLMLSLAEVAPAVEWYNAPQVYDGFDIRRVRLVMQVADSAAQD
jgi:hypothetical protein